MIWSPIVWRDTIYPPLAHLLNKYWGLWRASMQHIGTKYISKGPNELSGILWHPTQLAGKEQRQRRRGKPGRETSAEYLLITHQIQGKPSGLCSCILKALRQMLTARWGVRLPSSAHSPHHLPARCLGSLKKICALHWHFTFEALVRFSNSHLIWFQHLE